MGADSKRLSHTVLDPVRLKELITEGCYAGLFGPHLEILRK